MLDTILLFVFVLFSVLGVFVSAVLLLLKLSAPGGKGKIFLVALPQEDEKEYLLKIRWLEAVLAFTGLKDRISVISLPEKTENNGFTEEGTPEVG